MAKYLKLEELMITALEKDFKEDKAQELSGRYFLAKSKLNKGLLQWIRVNEPMLTDHSEDHIENVLNNAYKLLEKYVLNLESYNKDTQPKYSGLDLYILCMTILFHDVGNFFQRGGHNQHIQTVINDMFKDFFFGEFKREKSHIITAGRAHTGKNSEGTKDTLRGIPEIEHCGGEPVKLRDIASIVRLADELAEGPQRTCQYMLDKEKVSPESEIYHRYATCTHLMIDTLNGRVSVAYEIELKCNNVSGMTEGDKTDLSKLLDLIHERIFKLDQERKYCGYYCDTLKSIGETQVSFNFFNNGQMLDLRFESLVLTDLTVPGDTAKQILEGRDDLKVDAVVKEVAESIYQTLEEPFVRRTKSESSEDPTDDISKISWFKAIFGGKS